MQSKQSARSYIWSFTTLVVDEEILHIKSWWKTYVAHVAIPKVTQFLYINNKILDKLLTWVTTYAPYDLKIDNIRSTVSSVCSPSLHLTPSEHCSALAAYIYLLPFPLQGCLQKNAQRDWILYFSCGIYYLPWWICATLFKK